MLMLQFDVLTLPPIRILHRYMVHPAGGEPDPAPLAERLALSNPGMLQVAPRILSESEATMASIAWEATTPMRENRWGIPEPASGEEVAPEAIDLVLIPLVAFDRKGQRVGYGKGYYDRFLKRCRTDCLKLGLSYFEPIDSIDDPGVHDVPLDLCVTPYRAYGFT